MSGGFSILVACFNKASYLRVCLESIFDAIDDALSVEIIIVDDGSTDESVSIIQEYVNKHPSIIKLFVNDVNMGVGFTKRRLVALSSGEYFAFVDPDDVISVNSIKIMYDCISANLDVGVLYSNHYVCDNDLNVIHKGYCRAFYGDETVLTSQVISQFAVYRRCYYDNTMGIDAGFKVAEDTDIYLKMEEVSSLMYIDECLYYYRRYEGSLSSFIVKTMRSQLWDMLARYEACKRRGIPFDYLITNIDTNYNREISGILNGYSYRLGRFLLTPFIILKTILSKLI